MIMLALRKPNLPHNEVVPLLSTLLLKVFPHLGLHSPPTRSYQGTFYVVGLERITDFTDMFSEQFQPKPARDSAFPELPEPPLKREQQVACVEAKMKEMAASKTQQKAGMIENNMTRAQSLKIKVAVATKGQELRFHPYVERQASSPNTFHGNQVMQP